MTFRAAYEEAMQACNKHMGVSNLIRLGRDAAADKLLDDASMAQPYGFCVACVRISCENNTKLEAVIGHSLGEIAACCVAGVLSLHEAALSGVGEVAQLRAMKVRCGGQCLGRRGGSAR